MTHTQPIMEQEERSEKWRIREYRVTVTGVRVWTYITSPRLVPQIGARILRPGS